MERKGTEAFVSEVSIDEALGAQSFKLLLTLAAIACEGIPIQTIAPKAPVPPSGRFATEIKMPQKKALRQEVFQFQRRITCR